MLMLIDGQFLSATAADLLKGIPLTLELAFLSVLLGAVLALGLALMQVSGRPWLDLPSRFYSFVFRGTPLLVQIFVIYYGLGQFPAIRHSFLWTFLREPFWCAILAMALNTGAYGAVIIRGGLLSVPAGQVEAARACGMPPPVLYRRVVLPQALRQMLPAYSNEVILMLKDTSLGSIITLMEVTGVAAKLISASYRPVEVFIVAGAIYLALNFLITRLFAAWEHLLTPERRGPAGLAVRPATRELPHA
jgi:octopine/nopaline transport system permease protein